MSTFEHGLSEFAEQRISFEDLTGVVKIDHGVYDFGKELLP